MTDDKLEPVVIPPTLFPSSSSRHLQSASNTDADGSILLKRTDNVEQARDHEDVEHGPLAAAVDDTTRPGAPPPSYGQPPTPIQYLSARKTIKRSGRSPSPCPSVTILWRFPRSIRVCAALLCLSIVFYLAVSVSTSLAQSERGPPLLPESFVTTTASDGLPDATPSVVFGSTSPPQGARLRQLSLRLKMGNVKIRDIAISSNGSVFLVGSCYALGDDAVYVARIDTFNATIVPAWEQYWIEAEDFSYADSVAVNSLGIFVTIYSSPGMISPTSKTLIMRISFDGEKDWTERAAYHASRAIVAADERAVYVMTELLRDGNLLAGYNFQGERVWSRPYAPSHHARRMAPSPGNGVIVAHTSKPITPLPMQSQGKGADSHASLSSLNYTSGSTVWAQLSGSVREGRAVVYNDGAIYTASQAVREDGHGDVGLLARHTLEGIHVWTRQLEEKSDIRDIVVHRGLVFLAGVRCRSHLTLSGCRDLGLGFVKWYDACTGADLGGELITPTSMRYTSMSLAVALADDVAVRVLVACHVDVDMHTGEFGQRMPFLGELKVDDGHTGARKQCGVGPP